MDGIWAESQIVSLQPGASNTTNFSSVSATAPTKMGSREVQAAPNEQLLPSLSKRRRKRIIPLQSPSLASPIDAKVCMFK